MKKIVLLVVMIFLSQMCVASAFNLSNSLSSKNTTHADICFIENANYVIITTSDLEDAVKEFKTWKEYPGFSVEIVNISWISDNYNGKDLQEQIRNFLIDNMKNGALIIF